MRVDSPFCRYPCQGRVVAGDGGAVIWPLLIGPVRASISHDGRIYLRRESGFDRHDQRGRLRSRRSRGRNRIRGNAGKRAERIDRWTKYRSTRSSSSTPTCCSTPLRRWKALRSPRPSGPRRLPHSQPSASVSRSAEMNVAQMTSGAQLADTTVVQLLGRANSERPDSRLATKASRRLDRHDVGRLCAACREPGQRAAACWSRARRSGRDHGRFVRGMADRGYGHDVRRRRHGGRVLHLVTRRSGLLLRRIPGASSRSSAGSRSFDRARLGRAEQLRGIIVLDLDWTGEASASNKSLANFVGALDVDAHDYLQKESRDSQGVRVVSIGYTSGTTGPERRHADAPFHSRRRSLHHPFGPSMREEANRVVVHLPMSHTVARGQATTLPLIADEFHISARRPRISPRRSKR